MGVPNIVFRSIDINIKFFKPAVECRPRHAEFVCDLALVTFILIKKLDYLPCLGVRFGHCRTENALVIRLRLVYLRLCILSESCDVVGYIVYCYLLRCGKVHAVLD